MNQAEIDAARITWGCRFEILCVATHKISMQMGSATVASFRSGPRPGARPVRRW